MISIKVPPLGESIVEATVSRWHKNEGDAVAAGETIVDLDTDKITVEVPAQKAGMLAKRSKNEGDVVKVDDVLGELDETKAGMAPSGGGAAAAGPRTPQAASSSQSPAEAASTLPPASPPAQPVKSSPAARRTADERGVDIASVQGTGRGGV